MRRSVFLCAAIGMCIVAPVHAAEVDTDYDGLSDALEMQFGSDVRRVDTDGDGYSDGTEVAAGYSPNNTLPILLEREILVTISTQKAEKRLAGITIETFPVSTGLARFPTPIGTFTVKGKAKRAWSRSAKLWMPWWIHFTEVKGLTVGLHELPEWPSGKKEGANVLGTPASHGCIRLGVGSAKKVYDWVSKGTKVTVRQ